MTATTADAPPPTLDVDPDGIPDDLRGVGQWIVWEWEPRDGRWTKPPLRADGGGYARSNDRATWAAFGAAFAAYRRRGLAGVGFVLTPDDPFFFADLDRCRDPESGEIDDWALPIMSRFRRAHVEVSPTGTGIKIVGRGRLPGQKHVKPVEGREGAKIEIFDAVKYTTLTGRRP